MNVEVWLERVPGVSSLSQNVSGANIATDLNQNGALLEMGQQHVLIGVSSEDDVIPRELCRIELAGDIVGNSVHGNLDGPIGRCEERLTERPMVLVRRAVPDVGSTVLPDRQIESVALIGSDSVRVLEPGVSPNLPRFSPERVPESLCTPVDKDGEGILDPATHLTCYDVDPLEEPRPADMNQRLRVNNQFGEDQHYDVTTPTTVYLPSTKEIVEPPSAPCSPIEDGEFGLCRAIIGWGIDPRTGECARVSGCGCDERCEGRVFPREEDCLQQCGADPKPDPAGLIVIDDPIFFDLPINSLLYAVSGYDPGTDLCVTAIWLLRDASDQIRHCDDFGPLFPYVVIAPGEPAGCWNTGPNVELLSVSGCVDWAAFNSPVIPWRGASSGHTDEVDLELELISDVWSGTVRFYEPGPSPCEGSRRVCGVDRGEHGH